MLPYIKLTVLLLVLFFTSSLQAQAVRKPPLHRNQDESFTDREKLEIIERKAAQEKARRQASEERGLRYGPLRNSVQVYLPTTSSRGNARLEQLNRITPKASQAAQYWINYEYDIVADHVKELKRRGL